MSKTHLREVERETRPPPRPAHPVYDALASKLGISPDGLRREARIERRVLVEGIPWQKRPL
jgi:hypothetical protein